jgi:hypothetical protein
LRLEAVGDAGDVIDRELEKGTRLPGTIDNTKIFKHFIYLATISAFASSLRVPFTFTSDLQC